MKMRKEIVAASTATPGLNLLSEFEVLIASGGARTHNLRLRRPTLYPIELRTPIDRMVNLLCGNVKPRKTNPIEENGAQSNGPG
jgi:hypothetical protein